jgi:Lrp/AsnC family transcriptional regulator, leucine-responsive regulatory protein
LRVILAAKIGPRWVDRQYHGHHSVESTVIDATDREILKSLEENARISFRELGERVALSPNAAAERVKRLRARGVITAFRAVVDPAAAGRRLVALVDVRLAGPADAPRFEELIGSLESVTDAAHVTGRFDYHLRVACRDTGELDTLLLHLKTKAGVVESDTRIVLRAVEPRR